MARPPIICQTCNSGQLIPRRRYRMSGIVVFIGYLLLIPSIIGIAISVLMLFASGGATSQTMDKIKAETRQKLVSASVPTTTIEHVLNSQPLSTVEQQSLTPGGLKVTRTNAIYLSRNCLCFQLLT